MAGRSEDPYAVQTLLGWCIVGPANPPDTQTDEDSLVTCNRIVAKEIGCDVDDKGINFVLNESSKELINATAIVKERRGGLMVSALDSGASGLGSSPGRGHCVVFLGKTLYSHSASLHPGV